MRLYILLSLLILGDASAYSQNAVYALTGNSEIVRIDPGNCSYDVILNSDQTALGGYMDITYEQGYFYLCRFDGVLRVNPLTGQSSFFNLLGVVDDLIAGMTSDQAGHLYFSGTTLQKYYLSTGDMETIDSLPGITQGDLEIYENDFYIAAGVGLTPLLLKVDLNPLTVSAVDTITTDMYGMARYGALPPGTVFVSRMNDLLTIDLTTGELTTVCTNLFPYGVIGMSSGPKLLGTPSLLLSEGVALRQVGGKLIVTVNDQLADSHANWFLTDVLGRQIAVSNLLGNETVIDLPNNSSNALILVIELPGGSVYRQKLIVD